MNRKVQATLVLVALAALLGLLVTLVFADTPFQSVTERTDPMTFRYPSGQFRRIADNEIYAYNHAWSDTTGKGIRATVEWEFVNENADTVGVWQWENIPEGKYYFRETVGTDSTFSNPQYVRLGFDKAPPASVESLAVVSEAIKYVHLDPDSIIQSSQNIKSSVVRGLHIVTGQVAESDLAAASVSAPKLKSAGSPANFDALVTGSPDTTVWKGMRVEALTIDKWLVVKTPTSATLLPGTVTFDKWAVQYLEIDPTSWRVRPDAFTDLWSAQEPAPWRGTAVAGGNITDVAGTAQHQGIGKLASGLTANGGYLVGTSATALLLAGGETFECSFYVVTSTNLTARLGFLDTATSTQPTDGVWIEIAGTTLDGKCKNNAGPTATGTTYTISTATWYRAKIVLDATAARADFYVYNDAGTQLWTNNVTANIPTASGRETGHGAIATESVGSSLDLLWLDYLGMWSDRTLTR